MTQTNTMTTTLPTVTAAQAQAAHALASAYNHHWTVLEVQEVIGKTEREISALSVEREEPGIGCMNDAPHLIEEGYVTHTTGSKRLSWEISPEGKVRIEVSRPGAEEAVLTLSLPPQPYAEVDDSGEGVAGFCWTTDGDIRPLPRHIDAALHAVNALNGVNPNAQSAAQWLEQQRPQATRAAERELSEQLAAVVTADNAQVLSAIAQLARRLNVEDGDPQAQALASLKEQVKALSN